MNTRFADFVKGIIGTRVSVSIEDGKVKEIKPAPKKGQPPRKPYVCMGDGCTLGLRLLNSPRETTYCPYPKGHPQADETAVCKPVPEL